MSVNDEMIWQYTIVLILLAWALSRLSPIRADRLFVFLLFSLLQLNDLVIPTDSESERERVSRPLARRQRRHARLTRNQTQSVAQAKRERVSFRKN